MRCDGNYSRWVQRGWTKRCSFAMFFFVLALESQFMLAQEKLAPALASGLNYPKARVSDQSDTYFGTQVTDPYRWLEDVDSPQTVEWVEAENKVTFGYLQNIPQRESIRKRLTQLWNYERFGLPAKHGSRYFYVHNNGLQNQSVLYTADSLVSARQQLLDPNSLRSDGTVALSGWEPSEDGKLLAYGLANAGSDWNTWHVRDVTTGQDLDDKIEWVKFSELAWTKDGKGFFYSRYNEPTGGAEFTGTNYFQKLYFHRIGTAQSADQLVYERKDEKEWGFRGAVSDDGKYLIVSVWRGTEDKNLLFYKDLSDESSAVVELVNQFVAEYNFIGNDGPLFYFLTDDNAPKRRVIAVDTTHPERSNWRELIAEAKETIEGISLLQKTFFVTYLRDATSVVRRFTSDGKAMEDLKLPGIGTIVGLAGKRSDSETFFSFTNYITPPTIFRLDVESGASSVWRKPEIDFHTEDFATEQVFYTSKDGTKIPMILSYKKGMVRDGNRPTILYAYGGFNISVTPTFSPANAIWMELGGVYAVPNLRGGGEYGREWHEAGMLSRKQNVFDDFIGAAEFLIKDNVTKPSRLGISGRSNGGLLVGAAMTQRPELFGVALPGVGVMDMLRFHKFTIGWAWVNEYGSSDDAEQFKTLLAYSPLHNLREKICYPPTLITTADHDDRVVPGHSFKFAARLQAVQGCNNPTLIRIETRAGHGAGTPISKLIEATSDTWAFVMKSLNVE